MAWSDWIKSVFVGGMVVILATPPALGSLDSYLPTEETQDVFQGPDADENAGVDAIHLTNFHETIAAGSRNATFHRTLEREYPNQTSESEPEGNFEWIGPHTQKMTDSPSPLSTSEREATAGVPDDPAVPPSEGKNTTIPSNEGMYVLPVTHAHLKASHQSVGESPRLLTPVLNISLNEMMDTQTFWVQSSVASVNADPEAPDNVTLQTHSATTDQNLTIKRECSTCVTVDRDPQTPHSNPKYSRGPPDPALEQNRSREDNDSPETSGDEEPSGLADSFGTNYDPLTVDLGVRTVLLLMLLWFAQTFVFGIFGRTTHENCLENQARREIHDFVQVNPGTTVKDIVSHLSYGRTNVEHHLNILTRLNRLVKSYGRPRRFFKDSGTKESWAEDKRTPVEREAEDLLLWFQGNVKRRQQDVLEIAGQNWDWSPSTARRRLKRLVDLGLLRTWKDQHERWYLMESHDGGDRSLAK